MSKDLQIDIRTKARIFNGLLNILKENANDIREDADAIDLFSIIDSLYDAKETLHKMLAEVELIEQLVHELRESGHRSIRTRKKHTSL